MYTIFLVNVFIWYMTHMYNLLHMKKMEVNAIVEKLVIKKELFSEILEFICTNNPTMLADLGRAVATHWIKNKSSVSPEFIIDEAIDYLINQIDIFDYVDVKTIDNGIELIITDCDLAPWCCIRNKSAEKTKNCCFIANFIQTVIEKSNLDNELSLKTLKIDIGVTNQKCHHIYPLAVESNLFPKKHSNEDAMNILKEIESNYFLVG
jgi:hypothetical protein